MGGGKCHGGVWGSGLTRMLCFPSQGERRLLPALRPLRPRLLLPLLPPGPPRAPPRHAHAATPRPAHGPPPLGLGTGPRSPGPWPPPSPAPAPLPVAPPAQGEGLDGAPQGPAWGHSGCHLPRVPVPPPSQGVVCPPSPTHPHVPRWGWSPGRPSPPRDPPAPPVPMPQWGPPRPPHRPRVQPSQGAPGGDLLPRCLPIRAGHIAAVSPIEGGGPQPNTPTPPPGPRHIWGLTPPAAGRPLALIISSLIVPDAPNENRGSQVLSGIRASR